MSTRVSAGDACEQPIRATKRRRGWISTLSLAAVTTAGVLAALWYGYMLRGSGHGA